MEEANLKVQHSQGQTHQLLCIVAVGSFQRGLVVESPSLSQTSNSFELVRARLYRKQCRAHTMSATRLGG